MSGKQGEWCMIGEMAEVCEGKCLGHSPGDIHITLMIPVVGCHSYEAFEGWKSVCSQA